MKWPQSIVMVRHAPSEYNDLRNKKALDPLYKVFKTQYDKNHRSLQTKILARMMRRKYALGIGDWNTPLTQEGRHQAYCTGKGLQKTHTLPDFVYVSPYERTMSTYNMICSAWKELKNVPMIRDERLREQEHGLANIYNDWRIFFAHHPDQQKLHDFEGAYWYQYPQGENVPMVRERARSMLGTFIREHGEQKVLIITHHLSILSMMAAIERWDHGRFIDKDENEKPINCGVTEYQGMPDLGKDGKLVLKSYNANLWADEMEV